MSPKPLPAVVIIGRINVGKSSLFNRLTETGKALISPIPGTTRDYNLGQVDWRKKTFQIIDTGGINIDTLKNSIQTLLTDKKQPKSMTADVIEQEIVIQTKKALEKADLVLLVADGQAGLMSEDKELAMVLKKLQKPTILVCNKIDNQKYQHQTAEFFKLGLGKPWPVSAINGSGTGDLLDELVKKIKGSPGRPKKTDIPDTVKVALIGKPNVGKSSLLNKILNEKRVIVSDIPQTTREPQDTEISYQGKNIILIDTAGLRKKAKIEPGLEKMATRKTQQVIKSADVILLITEVDKTLTKQDSYLAGQIKDVRSGIIIVANKWDILADKDPAIDTKIINSYQRHFPYLAFVPIIFISAKTGRNVDKILDLILAVAKEKQKQVSDQDLEKILKKLVKKHWPSQAKGQNRPRLYSLAQTRFNPPEFTIMIGQNQSIHFSYLRFIENQLRENFGFLGVPVKIKVKTR